MISNNKPENKVLSRKSLDETLCNYNNSDINVVECKIQRPLVWSYDCIETLWTDLCECIRRNALNTPTKSISGQKIFNDTYMQVGNIEWSDIYESNITFVKDYKNIKYKSLVDGSQRNRMLMFLLVAMLYERAKINHFEHVDLSSVKINNGEYKLIELGSNELNDFYTKIETTKISQLEKEVVNLDKLINKFTKEGTRRDYFQTFSLFVGFIERDIIGTYEIDDVITIILNNVFFYEEYIDAEHKFERFVDRNKKNTPMRDEDLYPSTIVNGFDSSKNDCIQEEFKRFERRAEEAQNPSTSKPTFRKTKSGMNAVLFIMIEVLKIQLAKESITNKNISLNNVFTSTFDLKNLEYGIDKCFKKGLVFKNVESAVNYFKECYNFADFLIKDSFTRHDTLQEDCYYLRDFASQDVMWWYFIKPSYIAHAMIKNVNNRRFNFTKEALARLYFFYIVHRSGDTNSQNLINQLELLSSTLITFEGTDEEFEQTIRCILKRYITVCGGYDGLKETVANLTYGVRTHKNAIENIFIAMEYDIHKKFSLPTDTFYTLWKRSSGKPFNLDHWYPENKFKSLENNIEYQQIGNLVLLEEPLNKSKQDSSEVNSKFYTQSKYVQTLLMDKLNRGTFYNKDINAISSYLYFTRLDEDEVNNPTLENIRVRTQKYTDFFVNFIKDFVEK